MDVGVGLWCLRSTAAVPASHALLYRELVEDARLAEELGLHSLWLAEHHVWYDGWCPSLLVAGAAVLGATTRLHVGTGAFLLPLHDPLRIAAAGRTLEQLAPGRTELGVGLGYRDDEFAAVGLSRATRGARASEALRILTRAWADGGPRIWIGGIAERSLGRAAEHGLSLLLPSSMRLAQLREVIARAREAAARHDNRIERVGMVKDAWITDGSAAAERRMRDAIGRFTGEYGGAWWLLKGHRGFDAPELLTRQLERSAETATVGPPEAIASDLRELAEIGIDLVVLKVANDFTRPEHRENMRRIAAELVPALA